MLRFPKAELLRVPFLGRWQTSRIRVLINRRENAAKALIASSKLGF